MTYPADEFGIIDLKILYNPEVGGGWFLKFPF
jgi:hypothetical protein